LYKLEKKLNEILNRDIGLLILRLSIALLMLVHGIHKATNGIDGIKFLVEKGGLPELLAYGVYVGELIIPILLIMGLFTRISAIFFAINMIFATFLAHSSEIFSLGEKGEVVIELQLLYFLGAVAVAFLGAGKYSLDYKQNNYSK
jgi:putative oxidoreductase